MNFTDQQIMRYARHIILNEIGVEGQKKLLNSKVLIIGAGGLGSSLIYYLSAAGVGKIGIVENDVVDISNLQRQIIHDTLHLGVHKGESAKEKVNALNPDVDVVLYKTFIDSSNAIDIIKDYDVVVDGSDNFQTRFLINDACYLLNKPLVHGAVLRFEGQVSVFVPSNTTPCYRCIYEEAPPPGFAPSCKEVGVLGAVVGVIGTIQATETIKLITGVGEPLVGKLLVYDALYSEFNKYVINKNPNCPLCGENKKIKDLKTVDYSYSCAI
ncbi:MAG: molybdopterin-synthase adenylyltransferase MoeB [Spirochaetia bacterium]|nr:molybdopterin-synthase adenylyltransferase MoeB [Spirochaetota bacterium]MCX8097062.1 molybdopterin-synthase adenylyltransferase MoeB [Spirochaetota bacterium]MDW8111743.1 molybdopterin-synthase adenylyltransferase MoeB [Spirochaetia bacterium]